ncbi:MAG: hypothetical protein NTU82_00190 [Actinobacteria bacterium]|nr:hypothetical protein [Actinomycetota bacterium]
MKSPFTPCVVGSTGVGAADFVGAGSTVFVGVDEGVGVEAVTEAEEFELVADEFELVVDEFELPEAPFEEVVALVEEFDAAFAELFAVELADLAAEDFLATF